MRKTQAAINVRGETLHVDAYELLGQSLVVEGRFLKILRLQHEMADQICEPDKFIAELKKATVKADIFTFWERLPRKTIPCKYSYICCPQAILFVSSYEQWWQEQLNKKTRNRIRKSLKSGVEARTAQFDGELVRQIKAIFDESPIKRRKPFWHYNKPTEVLKTELARDLEIAEFIGAYTGRQLAGFAKIIYRDEFVDPVLFLSRSDESGKCVNNLLMAKMVERCAEHSLRYIHYSDWRLGSHADFLRRNGFQKVDVRRYYVPLTLKGRAALFLGVHRRIWDRLPEGLRVQLLGWRGSWHAARMKMIDRWRG